MIRRVRTYQTFKAKAIESKFGRTMLALVGSGIIICSGCGNGDTVLNPTEPEAVQVAEVVEEPVQVITRYDGESVYFKLNEAFYEGSVVEGISADEVLVEVAGGFQKVINVDRIGGTLIADHPDLGVTVVILGDPGKGLEMLTGRITAAYSDDMRKIVIHHIQVMGRPGVNPDPQPIRFVSEHNDFEDGGYLTVAEFMF